ncbi:nuclear transport factor 2 family protein [Paludisphaera mucosa]|uniref:Nuclear transport factor 2 family protein n=1 Tax=Paludisphaera mucosa TaxID=3030827 RepID=A0ABT6FCY6_9BACT|nr:nuclear transport factor 2 family protein [Paludisphaera mucosa]MDG3005366.1 nuclear transport factor 2 family protein [Paludisphaera mucosa]
MAQEHLERFLGDIAPAFRAGDPDVATKEAESRNVAVLQEVYKALAGGDFEAALATLHDDVELEITGPADMPFRGRWKGRAEVGEALRRNFAMIEDQEPVIRSIEAQGDQVDVVFHEHGRVRETGAPYAVLCAQSFTIRDGKILGVEQYVEDLTPPGPILDA